MRCTSDAGTSDFLAGAARGRARTGFRAFDAETGARPDVVLFGVLGEPAIAEGLFISEVVGVVRFPIAPQC